MNDCCCDGFYEFDDLEEYECINCRALKKWAKISASARLKLITFSKLLLIDNPSEDQIKKTDKLSLALIMEDLDVTDIPAGAIV